MLSPGCLLDFLLFLRALWLCAAVTLLLGLRGPVHSDLNFSAVELAECLRFCFDPRAFCCEECCGCCLADQRLLLLSLRVVLVLLRRLAAAKFAVVAACSPAAAAVVFVLADVVAELLRLGLGLLLLALFLSGLSCFSPCAPVVRRLDAIAMSKDRIGRAVIQLISCCFPPISDFVNFASTASFLWSRSPGCRWLRRTREVRLCGSAGGRRSCRW